MIKRIRDKVRQFKPQQKISLEEWEFIEDQWSRATTFLEPNNPAYQILKSDLKEAEDIVLENRVHEVKEVRIIGEIQKIFTIPKEEQSHELVGQIKYIRSYLAELESWITRKQELEHLESEGKIVIQRNKEINNE